MAQSPETGAAGTDPAEKPQGLWRNRDFGLLLSGQVVSFLGSQVQVFALPLLVLAVSGSPAQAGLVMGLSSLSWLLFGPFAGALADRWDRKTTMILCDLGRAVVTVSVPLAMWLDGLTVAQLCAVAVLNGVLETLFESANSAALPNIVGPGQLGAALGRFETATNTVRIGGGMVAGALYSLGRAVPFVVDAVSFVVSAVSLRFTRAQFQEERSEETPAGLLKEVRAGLGWLMGQPLIRFLALISAADAIRYGAGYLVIITLAERIGASPTEIGFIFTGAAVGAMLGALVSSRINDRFPLGRIATVTLWVEALMFPLYAVAPNAWLLGAVAAAESVLAPVYMVALSSYRLAATPDHLRGRVSGAVQTLGMSAMSLGALIGGVMIDGLGPRTTTVVFGGWLVLLAVATTVNRAVRRSAGTVRPAPVAKAAPAQS